MFVRLLMFILMLSFIQCSSKGNKKIVQSKPQVGINYNQYNSVIDSLGVSKYYKEAKWLMYCIHCDLLPEWRIPYTNIMKKPCAYLDLEPHYVQKNDSIVKFLCEFLYNDTLPLNINTISNYHKILDGVQFNIKTGDHRYIMGTSTFVVVDSQSRYYKPLQPEVVEFINKKKDSLYPWFREEAKRRGVIK